MEKDENYSQVGEELIKSKFVDQSALNVKLNFLKGKSFKKIEKKFIKNNILNKPNNLQKQNSHDQASIGLNPSNRFNYINTNEFNSNDIKSSNTNINFNKMTCNFPVKNFQETSINKFLKKPISFRITESQEKNISEKDEISKINRTFANQRFFGIFSNTPINREHEKFFSNSRKCEDDIEKVVLLNNEEELVKKYVLPEAKYYSNEELKKLQQYDVNDESDKFIICKGNGVFLSDLLKSDIKKSSFQKNPINACEKNEDMNSGTKVDFSRNTQIGIFPKCLRKSSSFVKYGQSPIKSLNTLNEFINKNIPNISNSYYNDPNKNLQNFSLDCNENYREDKIDSTRSYSNGRINKLYAYNSFKMNNLDSSKVNLVNMKKPKLEIKEEYFPHIFKSSTNGFLLNSLKKIRKFKNLISQKFINNYDDKREINACTSKYGKNEEIKKKTQRTRNNILMHEYISNSDYTISNNNMFLSPKKNNRSIYLDYPQIKFPIKPYRKINNKKNINTNYLTNGLIVNNVDIINEIKGLNKEISDNLKKDVEIKIHNEMSENIDKLNVIEQKIQNLVEISKLTMQKNTKYKNFSSNDSISILNKKEWEA